MKTARIVRPSQTDTDLNTISLRFKLIQRELESLERVAKGYRAILEHAALEHGGVLETEDFKITATPANREIFSLKDARQKISDKVLSPFVRVSRFHQVRVSERRTKVAA